MDVALLLMVLGVMLSGFRAADALDHIRQEILRQEGKRRGWWVVLIHKDHLPCPQYSTI